jgi:hypothetical protein
MINFIKKWFNNRDYELAVRRIESCTGELRWLHSQFIKGTADVQEVKEGQDIPVRNPIQTIASLDGTLRKIEARLTEIEKRIK